MTSTTLSDSLRNRQQQLMATLLGRRGADLIEDAIVEQGGITIDTRLDIYRNAYRARLRETLDTDHPITGAYLGDALFEKMVQGYIDEYPSPYRSLRQYADNLPPFLNRRPPFCEHPEIAELARFERLLLTAFDAAEAPRKNVQALSRLPAEAWPGLKVVFHPSVQLFESAWNVVEIWQALKAKLPPPVAVSNSLVLNKKNLNKEVLNKGGLNKGGLNNSLINTSAWLLWRNSDYLTEFRTLDTVELLMLKRFLRGDTGAEVCEALTACLSEEAVSEVFVTYLYQWLSHQVIRALI